MEKSHREKCKGDEPVWITGDKEQRKQFILFQSLELIVVE